MGKQETLGTIWEIPDELWERIDEAAWEQAISGQDYGRSEVPRKRAGSGGSSRKGSREAVGRSQVAATFQLREGKFIRGPSGAVQVVQGPSEAVKCRSGSRMCCHTRVQGFASVPKREVGGRFERETGGKEGKWSQSCEHFGERVGSGKVAAVPKREVTRRTG